MSRTRQNIDTTWRVPFSTRDGSGGAIGFSATIEVADFDVYKDASATQRTSTAGFGVTESFDSITGAQYFTVDLSDNTDASFYAAGSDLDILFTPDETVDSQTIAEWLSSVALETAAQQAVRLYAESVYPTGCVVVTTTGNTTSRINLTDFLDAQTTDADQVGKVGTAWDATNGQVIEFRITSVQSARLFNVENAVDGSALDFTVAAGDRVWVSPLAAIGSITAAEDGANLTSVGVASISGSTVAADRLEEFAEALIVGTTSGTPSTTQSDTSLTGYADDELIGRTIVFKGGTADGQSARITDYTNTGGVVKYTTLATAPAASDAFVII